MPKELDPTFVEAYDEPARRIVDLLYVWFPTSDQEISIANWDVPITCTPPETPGLPPFTVPMQFLAIPFRRSEAHTHFTLEIDEIRLELPGGDIMVRSGATPAFTAFQEAAVLGLFDEARIYLYFHDLDSGTTIFHSDWLLADTPKIDHLSIEFHLQSGCMEIERDMPKGVFCEGCLNDLYGTLCGVDPAGHTYVGTVLENSTRYALWTDLDYENEFFALGTLIMDSGPAAGAARLVKQSFMAEDPIEGQIIFHHPLPKDPEAGDQFTIVLGCNKTLSQCALRYGNRNNFRGFPYIPRPEVIV